MSFKFSGSGTATVCGVAAVKVVKADHEDGEGEINVTHAGSLTYEYEADMDNPTVSFDALGADALVRGRIGATTFTWNDGGVTSLGRTVLVGKKKAGSIGDKIVYTLKIRPAPPA